MNKNDRMQNLADITLIIGIGNPGEEYAHTLHNAGKLFVEWLSGRNTDFLKPSGKPPRQKWIGAKRPQTQKSILWRGSKKHFWYRKQDGVVFVLTTTFMNESGLAAQEALAFFDTKPGGLLVAHDDSDIALGDHTYSFNRGAAGHHGVESIIRAIGTSCFWRLRIGIRPLSNGPRKKAEEFVLKNASAANLKKLQGVFEAASTKLIVKHTPSPLV